MNHFSEINHKKKSLVITILLFVLLFALLLLLKYNSQNLISNLESGGGGGEIAVNFGNSDSGSGNNTESLETPKPVSKPLESEKIQQEQIVTNTTDNQVPAIIVSKKPVEIPKKPIEKPIEKAKPSKATTDALSNLLNNSNSKEGDGNDNQAGNKGKITGNPNEKNYDGTAESGNGLGKENGNGIGTGTGYGIGTGNNVGTGNWKLSGRKLSKSSKQVQKCNEYGIVVVQVTVNRNGDVIAAKYAKGTTNTSPCLLEPAFATAKSYKWQPDEKAPETQIGFITINFKVSE